MQLSVHCDSLGELDQGQARNIINAAIREAVTDLEDRGTDGVARQVHITLFLKPMDNGLVATSVEAHARLPRKRTESTVARPVRQGGQGELVFSQHAAEDPDQTTMDEFANKEAV